MKTPTKFAGLAVAFGFLLAPLASAHNEGETVTIRNPTQEACLNVLLQPHGVSCARAAAQAEVLSCYYVGQEWGCALTYTVTLTLDPGVCGRVEVAKVSNMGCWNPEGAALLMRPSTGTGNGDWLAASFDGLEWVVQESGRVTVQDLSQSLSPSTVWRLQIVVPEPPPPPSSGGGCSADGASFSAAASLSGVVLTAKVPEEGIAISETVPLWSGSRTNAGGGGGEAAVAYNSPEVNC